MTMPTPPPPLLVFVEAAEWAWRNALLLSFSFSPSSSLLPLVLPAPPPKAPTVMDMKRVRWEGPRRRKPSRRRCAREATVLLISTTVGIQRMRWDV